MTAPSSGLRVVNGDDVQRLPSRLMPGDWILWAYGHEESEWYVLANSNARVKIGKESWLVSSSMWVSHKELLEKGYMYLGQSSFRWWWKFIPWRNCILPVRPLRGMWWL